MKTLFTAAGAAQTPSIDTGGVVNVASYAYADLPSGAIAQGALLVGSTTTPKAFRAVGIDVGYIAATDTTLKDLLYK